MTDAGADRTVILEWGIRASLIAYMARDPHFEIEAAGGATFSVERGLRMSGRSDSAGLLRFEGSVVLRAHQGALTVPLADVQVSSTELTVQDTASEPDRSARMPLMHLADPERHAGGVLVYATRLAPEADALFLFNYLPQAPFDPLRLTFRAG